MDNNNSNIPNIDNSHNNAVTPNQKNTAESNNIVYNEVNSQPTADAVQTNTENVADNTERVENNQFPNQQIQVPVHQCDNQPKANSFQQTNVAQQQADNYQSNTAQPQFTTPQMSGYQQNQVQTPQFGNNQPADNYQNNVAQPQFNTPQMGGYQQNTVQTHPYGNSYPTGNYQPNNAQSQFVTLPFSRQQRPNVPQQQFNNQQQFGFQPNHIPQYQYNNRPMGAYPQNPMVQQQFVNQQYGNQQYGRVYNQPVMPQYQFNNRPQMQPQFATQQFNAQQTVGCQPNQMQQQFNNQANVNAVANNMAVNNAPVQQNLNVDIPAQNTAVQQNQNANISVENTAVQQASNVDNTVQNTAVQQNPNVDNTVQNTPAQQNPYAGNFAQNTNAQQAYNQNMPQIEYVPYVPGSPLPYGVTPQFINGDWYYPMVVKPKKKKMATPVKVFMGIIIGLTVFFTVLLCFWVAMLSDGNGNMDDFFFEFDSSVADDADDDRKPNKYADPNGPEIVLEDQKTKDGSTEKAYEELSESVVSVSVYDEDEQPSNSVPIGEGTGIIISEDGYIVTNSHVIFDDTDSNVWITTKSGDVYPAEIVGCDVRTDLAVLICEDADNWECASFADSDELKVGQDVVALGSPGGSSYSNSITRGIVSALDRPLSGSAVTYIQTDAAINPGNSGGPLANMNGQVVGINTIKVVDTQFEGMGFAIPSVTIKKVADELIKNGYVTGRVRLAISVTEFSDALAKYYGAEPGAKIVAIEKDSPLKDTKVEKGDIITEIDGKSFSTLNEMYNILDEYQPGDEVELTIYRFDENDSSKNKEFTVEIELLGDE